MNETNYITPDFSEEGKFELAPGGKYHLRVASAPKLRKTGERSKKAGLPYLTWEFSIDGEGARYGHVFETTMLAGKGTSRFRQTLKAIGFTKEQIETVRIKPLGAETEKGTPIALVMPNGDEVELVGTEFDAILEVEERDNYEPRNRIAKFA